MNKAMNENSHIYDIFFKNNIATFCITYIHDTPARTIFSPSSQLLWNPNTLCHLRIEYHFHSQLHLFSPKLKLFVLLSHL